MSLVVHVPHASTDIPEDAYREFLISPAEVRREAEISADLYTDLLAKSAWPSATIVHAEVSRLIMDVERYESDELEEMAEVGRGVLYTHDHQGRQMRHPPSSERRKSLLDRYYHPHWRKLREAAAGAVLIDLHSYPTAPWPVERHAAGERPEIDLGFTSGLTPLAWISDLTEHFMRQGYRVAHNTPYVGVIDVGARASVMIELRRDIVDPSDEKRWARLVASLESMPDPPPPMGPTQP